MVALKKPDMTFPSSIKCIVGHQVVHWNALPLSAHLSATRVALATKLRYLSSSRIFCSETGGFTLEQPPVVVEGIKEDPEECE